MLRALASSLLARAAAAVAAPATPSASPMEVPRLRFARRPCPESGYDELEVESRRS